MLQIRWEQPISSERTHSIGYTVLRPVIRDSWDDSLISRINHAAGRNPVQIDVTDIHLFDLCDTLHFLTEGLFDPTTLPLSRLWDFKADNPQVPSESEISEALSKIGWKKVHRESHSIFLPETGMGLDFGGFGKEYAVDRVADLAREHELDDFLIDFGGDVFASGSPPDAPAWRVGLEDPRKQDQAKRIFSVSGHGCRDFGELSKVFRKERQKIWPLNRSSHGLPNEQQLSVRHGYLTLLSRGRCSVHMRLA